MPMMRLDKFLSEMKKGSRSQVKELIRKGKVTVDGHICKEPEAKVDPAYQDVSLSGQPVAYAKLEYYMLNKPQGVVSATEDNLHKTVLDLIKDARRKDLFPVGRLDIDTEGLLLITNDGKLAHELLSPKKHVDKVYYAKVAGILPKDLKEQFKLGITLNDGTPVLPADLLIESAYEEEGIPMQEVRLTIREGKFHQVKRMFEAVGGKVVFLKRLSMGRLKLDESLSPGEYRPLTSEEQRMLQSDEIISIAGVIK